MKLGYCRVSKHEQNESLQMDALTKAGCSQIFKDKSTGAKFDRKGLEQLMLCARSGDTVVVWKLDRLGRSLKHLIETLQTLQARGVEFVSLTEAIDTSTPGGKLIFHVMGALAEFERDLIRERTTAGLEAARARGHKGGRKQQVTPGKIEQAKRMHTEGQHQIKEICQILGFSKATLYRYLTENEQKEA